MGLGIYTLPGRWPRRIIVVSSFELCMCVFLLLFIYLYLSLPLSAGSWLVAAWWWLLAAGCHLLAPGSWQLAAGYGLYAIIKPVYVRSCFDHQAHLK